MTRPVLSDEESFSFILPSSVPKAAAPEPLDRRVKLVEISPRKLAVLRFSGRVHSESVKEKEESLLATLRKRGIETKGQVFLMRYNGPGTPGFLRRNEVGVEIMGDMGKG